MSSATTKVHVMLPSPLSVLAGTPRELTLDVATPVTMASIIDAIEAAHPALVGTIRERGTNKRRALVRFFACEQDFSHEPLDTRLPDAVASGAEPFNIVGAIAGG